MINFTAGAWRPAKDGARATHLDPATDLVTRTLAQHGLTAPAGLGQGAGPLPSAGLAGVSGLRMPATPDLPLPEGARFEAGTFTCAAGSRRHRTYVPASAKDGVAGIVMMLHGCTQTPEDFAAGTGMNALAETHRLVVVYPHQARGENAQSCWNWFRRGDQRRDRGEPAILAGMARQAAARHGVAGDRIFAAGLSAGAAMAVILGQTHPDVFSAIGAHSGLPMGAATDVPSAFAAMAGQGAEAAATGAAVRTIVFHGTADATVHPSNGDRIIRQALDRGPRQTLQTEDRGTAAGRAYRRTVTRTPEGGVTAEHWCVEGLSHAWSGGRPAGSYTDPQGPDASAEMVRFFLS